MPEPLTPQWIRDIRFREKVRGYHPTDVDEFVAKVAAEVEELQARCDEYETRVADLQASSTEASEAEDSLRRTLVLAQRTADLAIQEARVEAARLLADATERRDALVSEVEELRARLHAEVEEEFTEKRQLLHAERDALQGDVHALDEHFARERERLRIYFTDQLRRVEEGVPGVAAAPQMQGPPAPVSEAIQDPEADTSSADANVPDADIPDANIPDASVPDENDPESDDDAFLAELRRAVTDEAPLGPREDPLPESDDDPAFDLFSSGSDDHGRFGSRLRRRR